MTRIEAAEKSFEKADRYFVFAWVVVAVVLITSLVDWRSYQRGVALNDAQIALYQGLEREASEVAQRLRTAIYLSPGYTDEESGIEALRRLRSEVIADLVWIEANYGARVPGLATEDRLVLQPTFNFMRKMLRLNDPTGLDYESVAGEPALRRAEHDAGSYLVAERIAELRLEDAARYLWMSSLDLRHWRDLLDKHRAALVAERPRADMVEDFRPLVARASTEDRRADREVASSLWTNWLVSADGGDAVSSTEARRRAALTVAQTTRFLDEALARAAQLDRLARGQESTVEIPLVALPLQLRDAIVAAPWILAFCSFAIMIYTRRALRHVPDQVSETEVVGNVPKFYAVYGVNSVAGIFVAVALLWLPAALMAALVPALQPIPLAIDNLTGLVFFGGVAVSILVSLGAVIDIPRITRLMDRGIIVKSRGT